MLLYTSTESAPVLHPAPWPRLPDLHGHGGAVADLLQLLLEHPRLAPDSCRGKLFIMFMYPLSKEHFKESKVKLLKLKRVLK